MGCAASRKREKNNVVELCGERKRLLKLILRNWHGFADAQSLYNQSLYAVAMAIRLFVDRNSSPNSPFLVQFPFSSSSSSSSSFLEQGRLIEETYLGEKKELDDDDDGGGEDNDHGGDNDDDDDGVVCEHFYDEMAIPTQCASPNRGYGWDFFDPFDKGVTTETVSADTNQSVHNGDLGHENGGFDDVAVEQEEKTNLDGQRNGSELLEALNYVEDHFLKAYESGLDISRMLEASRVQFQSSFEEFKENSSKLSRTMTWNQSTFSRSLSQKCLLSSTSKSSSMWMDSMNDLLGANQGMKSGNHSSTLERLYIWEKKLYQEVKIGDKTRRIYKRGCSLLKKNDTKRAELKDLQMEILVSVTSIELISEKIQKLRDEELQPQIVELLHGLMRNWKTMVETLETQNRTMMDVKSFNCSSYGKYRNEPHRLATLQLEAELQIWGACFASYIFAQKKYVEALFNWLSKLIAPEVEFYFMVNGSFPPCGIDELPLFGICHHWLAWLENLPDKAVTNAMKSFGKDVHAIWDQQGEEEMQKKKVDKLVEKLDHKVLAIKKAENKMLETKVFDEDESEENMKNRIKFLADGKKLLSLFQKRLDAEKAKHQTSITATQEITINRFQMGFSAVFRCLAEFSKASAQMYANLVMYSEKTKVEGEKRKRKAACST